MNYLKLLYDQVFNSDGSVKNCGKDKCIELICALKDKCVGIDFGNQNTGMMNIREIRKIFSR